MSTKQQHRTAVVAHHRREDKFRKDLCMWQRHRHDLQAAPLEVRNIKLEQSVGKVHIKRLVKKVVYEKETPT